MHRKFNVLFNSKKSRVIIYKAYNVKPPDPCVTINDARVKCVDKVIHLGDLLTENVICPNVLMILIINVTYFLLILNIVVHIQEMFYSKDIVLVFMELKCCLILIQIYKMCILHGG